MFTLFQGHNSIIILVKHQLYLSKFSSSHIENFACLPDGIKIDGDM